MKTGIPTNIKMLLDEYSNLLRNDFDSLIIGVYIYGSISLGAFNINKSDIDFITILKRKLTLEETSKLEEIHKVLVSKYEYAKKMDGMYIDINSIGIGNDEIEPYPYYYNGIFHHSGYWDINNVTWWMLKNKSIRLMGIDNKELTINVT